MLLAPRPSARSHAQSEYGRSDLGMVLNKEIENGGIVLDAAFDFQDSDCDGGFNSDSQQG